ncbi:hypothetical protein ACFO4E_28660 [Nocardiopsis mangrovi]|uniref:DUF3558 domain-containing protein n=1 Tax=Nocardiopsis mangrovi TaxID=1179818 RepID=A0ABV9E3T8_9ACTN
MALEPTNAPGARWAIGGFAAVMAVALGGCGTQADGDASAAPPVSESPEPLWTEFGGEPLSRTAPSAGAASAEPSEEPEPVEEPPMPESCEATGVMDDITVVTGRMTDPEFTEVRGDQRLECSWAGFSTSDGSEVVMVTYTPGGGVVEYPGHTPEVALGSAAFFSTDGVAALGGIAEWHTGEMFSGADLHLPGMLVSISSNSDDVQGADLLEVATATAGTVVGGRDAAPEAGSGSGDGDDAP